MSRIHLSRRHDMGRRRAVQLATRMAESLEREHGLVCAWRDSVLRFHGPGLEGELRVDERDLRLDVTLGWTMRPFRRRLENSIHRSLDRLLRGEDSAGDSAP